MEVISMILVAGVAGGVVMALLVMVANRVRPGRRQFDAFASGTSRTDVINISSVRVAGVGGLGLIAVAIALAVAIPSIGQVLAFGALLGVGMATFLILRRRRLGPLPSSSDRPGANTTLSIDEPVAPEDGPEESRDSRERKARLSMANSRP